MCRLAQSKWRDQEELHLLIVVCQQEVLNEKKEHPFIGAEANSTMGNSQCLAPASAALDDDDIFLLRMKSSDATTYTTNTSGTVIDIDDWSSYPFQTKMEQKFLVVHRDECPEKVLLDRSEVRNVIDEQTEEILLQRRRAMTKRNHSNAPKQVVQCPVFYDDDSRGSSSSTCSDGSSFDSHDQASSFLAPSLVPSRMSVVTSTSAATEQVKNVRELTSFQKDFTEKYQGRDKKFAVLKHVDEASIDNMDTSFRSSSIGAGTMCYPVAPCSVADGSQQQQPNLMSVLNKITNYRLVSTEQQMIQRLRSVLYLEIPSQWSLFYYSYLRRLLPRHPLTLTIADHLERGNQTRFSSNKVLRPLDNQSIAFGPGPQSTPITTLVTGNSFMDLAISGSLGLVDRRRAARHYSNLNQYNHQLTHLEQQVLLRKRVGAFKSLEHYLVLFNRRSGIPLAVCALKAMSIGPPVVRIYATKRRVHGQTPASSTHKLGLDWTSQSVPLYSWAEINTIGQYPGRVRYSIYMATGSDGQFEETPSYRAIHEQPGSPEIRIVGRTEKEFRAHAGCAILSMRNRTRTSDGISWQMSIARGIDPALIICFSAFLDEVMEKTMRVECVNSQRTGACNGDCERSLPSLASF